MSERLIGFSVMGEWIGVAAGPRLTPDELSAAQADIQHIFDEINARRSSPPFPLDPGLHPTRNTKKLSTTRGVPAKPGRKAR